MNSYFNTTSEPDPTLFEVKARTQEQIILEIFRSHENLTASECHKLFPGLAPLTSIRRAITNLATDTYTSVNGIFRVTRYGGVTPQQFPMCALFAPAKLFKTDQKRIGIYGRPEYAYEIIDRL
ncbi:MAG: hypothetical protein WC341_17835 [Bacteroidales bacterium]|jgi:hypothetical protein